MLLYLALIAIGVAAALDRTDLARPVAEAEAVLADPPTAGGPGHAHAPCCNRPLLALLICDRRIGLTRAHQDRGPKTAMS